MSADEVCRFSSLGTSYILYVNRLEIRSPGLKPKREVISYRNITTLEKPAFLNRLDVKTNDGKTHKLSLMDPADTARLKERLESLL